MTSRKEEIITFKVDRTLAERMRVIENRSDFIRRAVLNALENTCPLCMGTGQLSETQRRLWGDFLEDHALEEVPDTHELHLVCRARHTPKRRKKTP
ncbi:MAG: CopG family transcriptional regulator [Candidatus Sumerlaeia bacterium]|nr:CopG family transcriptional regulator [Candidatus Sumerlaeia bacterium]